MTEVKGQIEFDEGSAAVAPAGKTRIGQQGGVLVVSSNGEAFASLLDSGTGGQALAVVSNVSATPLAAPATSISVSGLDGDADGDYRIWFEIKAVDGSGTGALKVQINDADTNLYGFALAQLASDVAPTPSHTSGSATFSGGPSTGDYCSGWILVRSRSGGFPRRTCTVEAFTGDGPRVDRGIFTYADSGTNITKISIVAGTATSMDVGSTMFVEKLWHRY